MKCTILKTHKTLQWYFIAYHKYHFVNMRLGPFFPILIKLVLLDEWPILSGWDWWSTRCVSEEYCFSEVNGMTNFTECFQLWRSRTACWIANNHSSRSSSDSHAMYNTNFLFLTSSYNVFGLLFLFLAQIHFLLMHRHNRRGGGLPSRFHNLSIGNRLLSYKSPVKPLCPPPPDLSAFLHSCTDVFCRT